MPYVQYRPSPPLSTFVKSVYFPAGFAPYACEKVLPFTNLDLKINLGGALSVHAAGDTKSSVLCDESWVVGLWNTYHTVHWPPDLRYYGVTFNVGAAYPLLGIPLSEFHNQVVSLDAIWGRFAEEIRERLYHAPTPQARCALLEQFLLDRLREPPHELRMIQYAVTQIAQHHGQLSIRGLSDEIGISQKHLITQFKRMVGAAPKEFARLYRFEHIIRGLDPTLPVDWGQVAYESGYYDQPHFTRDFEEFTGHTPTDYLRLRRQGHAESSEHTLKDLRVLPTG